MKILVNNIAKIEHAEVAVQGVSVLAGYNATGKSTVSKSLNAMISAYTDILERVELSQYQSIWTILNDLLDEIFRDSFSYADWSGRKSFFHKILKKEVQLPEEYESFRVPASRCLDVREEEFPEATPDIDGEYRKFLEQLRKAQDRPKEEYIKFEVEKRILRAFDNQINTIGRDSIGGITLSDDSGVMLCEASFRGNRLQSCSYKNIRERTPIYLEPKHSLDSLPSDRRVFRQAEDPIVSDLLAHDEEFAGQITIEVQEKLDRISAMINEAIHGGLVENGASLQYMDEQSSFISLKNLASGNKTFAVIKRLLENGQLYRNQTLIIDEPEVNLHPEWQLILAKVLVILYRELGLKVFLNSHSPYFIRAVEVCSKQYGIADHCFFYRTIEGNNGSYQVEDVTEETEKIYRALYRPLEEL